MLHRVGWLLVTLTASAIFAGAGVWQYQRGLAKQTFMADFSVALTADPVAIDNAIKQPTDLPRPVAGTLRLRPSTPWLLLDNVRYAGQIGIRAVAAYQASDSTIVLVDFGWLPLSADRSLPVIDAPPEQLTARGLLVGLPSEGLRMGTNPWPATQVSAVLLTYVDIGELTTAFGAPPYAGLLRLDPALPVGFARDLEALPNTLSADKHFGYALQWFGFAAASVVIYLIFLFRKPRP